MDVIRAARRSLYRGHRSHRLARLLNRMQAALAARGLGPARVMVLEVAGRRTGRTITFPVVVADFQGERYLVSMLGDNTNWVRNVRAAGGRAALRHGRRRAVHLDEVCASKRAPILRRYLECAPGARAHIPVEPGAPLSRFEQVAGRYPVFRVTEPAPVATDGTPEAGTGTRATPPPVRVGGCDFDLAIAVDRPPSAVYALLADVQDAEPIPRRATVRMVKDPAGPTAVGTRWHERVRLAPGWWLAIDSVVTHLEPPGLLGMDFGSRWFTGHLTYRIDGTADHSVLHQREILRPRLLMRPLAPFIDRRLRPQLSRRLEDIKQVLET